MNRRRQAYGWALVGVIAALVVGCEESGVTGTSADTSATSDGASDVTETDTAWNRWK